MFKWLAAAAAIAVVFPLALVLLVATGPANGIASKSAAGGPSVLAMSDIPPAYLALYMSAAQTCPGLPWAVLAGIGKVESDHGRSTAAGVHSGTNFAGAEGPMQFEPGTFARFATDGDHDGQVSPYDPGDAIYTAATMLCANGATSGTQAGIRQALFGYNHSRSYVDEVLDWAARYAVPTPSGTAETAIAFALRQVGKPYQWGAAGPNAYDCSGLVFAAYAAAGISIARTTFGWREDGPTVPLTAIEPGDLLFSAGSDGTNVNPGHVVMYLGGDGHRGGWLSGLLRGGICHDRSPASWTIWARVAQSWLWMGVPVRPAVPANFGCGRGGRRRWLARFGLPASRSTATWSPGRPTATRSSRSGSGPAMTPSATPPATPTSLLNPPGCANRHCPPNAGRTRAGRVHGRSAASRVGGS